MGLGRLVQQLGLELGGLASLPRGLWPGGGEAPCSPPPAEHSGPHGPGSAAGVPTASPAGAGTGGGWQPDPWQSWGGP
eukprot:3514397-Alexandrium_andersonii.AAC.1